MYSSPPGRIFSRCVCEYRWHWPRGTEAHRVGRIAALNEKNTGKCGGSHRMEQEEAPGRYGHRERMGPKKKREGERL